MKHRLLRKGDKILIGLSGGPDSIALLYALAHLSNEFECELIACYINHNIRPKAVRKEIKFCADICSRLRIPLNIVDVDIPSFSRTNKISLEEAGHIFRRTAFDQIARNEKCNKIALAHHRDDIVETILFRLFRGTGPRGLQPIKPISGNIIRPLCGIDRRGIEQFLKKNQIRFMIDNSNKANDFSRNYIRNKIIPQIEIGFGTKFRNGLINFTQILFEEDKYLNKIAEKAYRRICRETPGGKIIIDLEKLAHYDLWLRRRITRISLHFFSGHPGAGSFDEVERVEKMIGGEIKSANLAGGLTISREGNFLHLIGKKCKIGERQLPIGGKAYLPEISSTIKCRVRSRSRTTPTLQKKGYKVSLDLARIEPPLYIRGINPGDRFIPLGMKGAKKVGDFLTDRKIPRFLRDEIPQVQDRQGIVWLVGHQIAERTKIDKNTRTVLELELSRGNRNGKAKI